MSKVYKFWIGLLTVLGGCSLIYFIIIFAMLGPTSTFNYVWLLLACLCGVLIFFHTAVRDTPNRLQISCPDT